MDNMQCITDRLIISLKGLYGIASNTNVNKTLIVK